LLLAQILANGLLGGDGILRLVSTCVGAASHAVVSAAKEEWDDGLKEVEGFYEEAEKSFKFEVSGSAHAKIA